MDTPYTTARNEAIRQGTEQALKQRQAQLNADAWEGLLKMDQAAAARAFQGDRPVLTLQDGARYVAERLDPMEGETLRLAIDRLRTVPEPGEVLPDALLITPADIAEVEYRPDFDPQNPMGGSCLQVRVGKSLRTTPAVPTMPQAPQPAPAAVDVRQLGQEIARALREAPLNVAVTLPDELRVKLPTRESVTKVLRDERGKAIGTRSEERDVE